jgi:hypothetical protein
MFNWGLRRKLYFMHQNWSQSKVRRVLKVDWETRSR